MRAGQLAALRWARGLGRERVWAIEDCRHVSGRLERAVVGAGEHVVRVAPKLMGQSRRGERQPGKSDEIDAQAVARAALREGLDTLPLAWLDEPGQEIRLLLDHRSGLVAERTRMQNRLRWQLLELCPELEAAVPPGALDRGCWLDRIGDWPPVSRPCVCASRATSCGAYANSRARSPSSSANCADACGPAPRGCWPNAAAAP